MNASGGYFGLELNKGEEFHQDAIRLNTGRNAFEYLLLASNYTKVYLPFYSCEVLLQPIKKLNLAVEFYSIDENFEIIFDLNMLKEDEAFLYINYFGLKDTYITSLQQQCKNLVIDNVQSFFSLPMPGIDTFYSARKFFGVPDGAYVYTNHKLNSNIATDQSYQRFEHLLRRADISAEDGYASFVMNENALNNMPVLNMSKLTQSLLQSIDYPSVSQKRRDNFNYLAEHLNQINPLHFELQPQQVPMVYPLLTDDAALRKKLTTHKIYTATYWPNVLEWTNTNSIEYRYTQQLIHLPIDQRINFADLDKIINLIK